ncbi:MAG TPA: hypothetical protein VFJ06_08940 [Halococcus sp.]|nr:hypothetical protein [Halococcus sp.]
MCHHRTSEYTRLYEDIEEREELPEWAEEPDAADAEDEPEPFAPGVAD